MSSSAAVPQTVAERRTEARAVSCGEVMLRPQKGVLLRGEMVDISPGGFRIRYEGKRMKVGAHVEVLYPWNNTIAKIAWTIRSGDWIHAGLQFNLAEPD